MSRGAQASARSSTGSSSDPGESANALIADATRAQERPERGELRVLPSGDPSQHPAALLSGDALGTMFEELGSSRSTATSWSRARRCSGRWTASSSRAGRTP